MNNIETLYPAHCTLGESPLWHHKRQSCFWVDIHDGVLLEMNWETKEVKKWEIELPVSLVLENHDGDLILAVKGGIIKFNIATESFTWLVEMKHEFNNMRCNDGGCDVNGHLWITEMDMDSKKKAGAVYHIDNKMALNKMIDNVTIPNGITWSRDNNCMYFIDSPERQVNSYQYNKVTAAIKFDKTIITVPESMGVPDGMTIDGDGMLWVAMYGGGCVVRYDPKDGAILQSIKLPAPNITNCCFVGHDLDRLMVTSASEHLSEDELRTYNQSGNVFLINDPGARGYPNNLCIF